MVKYTATPIDAGNERKEGSGIIDRRRGAPAIIRQFSTVAEIVRNRKIPQYMKDFSNHTIGISNTFVSMLSSPASEYAAKRPRLTCG
jgi:hypothetical protein